MSTLHHTTIGSGPRAVVFLHGLFGQGKNFTGIAKALVAPNDLVPADDAVRCHLLDLPDQGRSPWTERIDQAAWADLVAADLTELLSGRPAVVVGHSLGGKTAMQLALRHPELVEALVVVDISPVASAQVAGQFGGIVAALNDLDLTSLGSRAEADEMLSRGVRDPVVRGFLLQNLRHDHAAAAGQQWRWQMNLPLVTAQLDQVGAWEVAPGVTFDGPVVWVAGDRSDYIRPEHAPAMRALFPKTRLVTVKGAGHWVHSEQPAAFTEILRHVLAG